MEKSKNTIARKKILELLKNSNIALSHLEIQEKAGEICNRVTIYRILERLEKDNIIHKIINLEGIAKYALCENCPTEKSHIHNHIHFSCTKCLELKCLEQKVPNILIPNYTIEEVNILIKGICDKCNLSF